jgi:hypothetical protein
MSWQPADVAVDGHDEGARTPAVRRQDRQIRLGFGEHALLALGVSEGDFRDWAEITEWAKTIAGAIGEEGSSDVR